MGRQTAGSRARQSGKKEADVKAQDELDERGQRTIYVDGKPAVLLGLDDLEWGEMAELEDFLGYPIANRIGELGGSVKVSLFLYYIVRRRDDSEYTLAQALRVPMSEISATAPAKEAGDDERPTSEAGDDERPTSEGGG